VPLFHQVAGEGGAGLVSLVGEECDLVDEVGVVWPAGGDVAADVPDIFGVDPGGDLVQPSPQLGS
jgi:hypothetical protein